MNCEEMKPALIGYLFGENSAEERKEIDVHLRSCHSCSQEIAELKQTVSLLIRGEASEEIPRSIRFAAEPAPAAGWWGAFWRYPVRVAFAGAGLLCVAIAILALFRTTISYEHGNFQLAFGAPAVSSGAPAVVATATPVVAHSLDREQVLQLIAQAMAAEQAEQERKSGQLAKNVSQQMEQRWQRDLSEMAGNLRVFQAAQNTMWKEQVQSEQLVSTLIQQHGLTTPAQP